VLVVHGIGSQRAQETVRGVVNAVWRDQDGAEPSDRKVWTHPERGPVDIDLAVMTTNAVPGSADQRSVDFHELYWAHLMSETKALAVLLWLFELGRKGPHFFKREMNGLWWCGAIFLCLMLLSASVLILQAIQKFCGLTILSQSLVIAPYMMVCVAVFFSLLVASWTRKPRLIRLLIIIALGLSILAAVFGIAIAIVLLNPFDVVGAEGPATYRVLVATSWLTNVLLPIATAILATWLLMGRWGLCAFVWAMLLSAGLYVIYLVAVGVGLWTIEGDIPQIIRSANLPWSLNSEWSAVVAWVILAIYLTLNAAFLQPYLGDAARYIRNSPANVRVRREIRRQSVDTLHMLHTWGLYDRIVVVAHSLGAIVAYDMLRTYYSKISDGLPTAPETVGPEFEEVDFNEPDRAKLRELGRTIIRKIASTAPDDTTQINRDGGPSVWLVTDFVALGSPLTHAQYLLCDGSNFDALTTDFNRRLAEIDLPTCPPQSVDSDGWLSFLNPRTKRRQCHHGGLFALTRWTNLYFPMKEIFWGDAIGGPSVPVFGSHVLDWEISTRPDGEAGFFTHTKYWDTGLPGGRQSDAIKALRDAIDLADTGVCNR
jgi:hypothetical protein